MDSATHIDRVEHHVWTVLYGKVSYADLQEMVTRLIKEDVLAFEQLYDLRSATPAFAAEDLTMIALRMKAITAKTPCGNIAVVVEGEWMSELMRMLQSLLEGSCVLRPFWTIEAAQHWLGWNLGPGPEAILATAA